MTKSVFLLTAIGLTIGNATYAILSSDHTWMNAIDRSFDDAWAIFTLWLVFKINGLAPRPASKE
jgi:hypothetical protein